MKHKFLFVLTVLCAMLAFVTCADAGQVVRSRLKVRRAPVARTVRVVRVQAVQANVCQCGIGCLCGPDCKCQ